MKPGMRPLFSLLLFLWGGSANVFAQTTHVMTVQSPASIAGDYGVQLASFGNFLCTISGETVVIRDNSNGTLGCGGIQNDLTGKIAVIDRGTCSFSEKVLNAQLKGAIAVLVLDNAASNPAIVNMGVTQPFAAQVTIPSYFVVRADVLKIRTALTAGAQVRIASRPPVGLDTLQRDIVWGNLPGQGDFAGGRNGWKVTNVYCASGQTIPKRDLWAWNGSGATPVMTCGRGIIASPTQCNGAMVFASNFYDDSGTECGRGIGTGDCPAPQLGELISPTIKLRGAGTPGYALKFYQSTRQSDSDYLISWSRNGGATWDTTAVNQDITANSSNTVPYLIVPLAGTGGADSLVVKFIYRGNYYHWIIDDVQILAQEANNLQVDDFYAIPPNLFTPLSQVEPIGFMTDVSNIGATDQQNVILNVNIKDANGTSVFSSNRSYGTLPANTVLENQIMPNAYTPGARGVYSGEYRVSATATDFDPNNNFRPFVFGVTDTTFSKEDGPTRIISPAASNWNTGEPHSAAYGNVFYTPKGKGVFSRSVSFGLANASAMRGRGLVLALYKWTDTNGDGLSQAAERKLLAFNLYEPKGTEQPADLISVRLPASGDPIVELEDNAAYLVMLEYYAPEVDGVDLQALVSDRYDYKAQVLLSLDPSRVDRMCTMTGLAGDLTQETYGPTGFGTFPGDYAYVMRWHVGVSPATPARELPSISDQFAVFPNPATSEAILQLALQQSARQATVRVIDFTGRVMEERVLRGVQRDMERFDLSRLPAGAYVVQVVTENGIGSKRLLVQR